MRPVLRDCDANPEREPVEPGEQPVGFNREVLVLVGRLYPVVGSVGVHGVGVLLPPVVAADVFKDGVRVTEVESLSRQVGAAHPSGRRVW